MKGSARAAVAAMILLPQIWIFQGGGWNQNSRFALARALVLRGSVRIDPDADSTNDFAVRDGHVYCDKAPGASVAAAVALAAVGPLAGALGLDPSQPWWWRIVPYLVTLLAVSLPCALVGTALYQELRARFGARAALTSIAAVFLGSPVLGYAGLLYGHALASALIAAGFVALARAQRTDTAHRRAVVLAGLASGLAIAVEYTAALGAAALIAWAASSPALRRHLVAGVAAAIPPIALLALYNVAAFGAPFAIGYQNLPANEFLEMRQGFFGLRGPTAQSLWQLTFGEHRGLFRYAPVMLLGLAGGWLLRKSAEGKVALGLFAAFLLLNASYVYWDGHASFGPRHAVPSFLVFALLIAAAAQRWPRASLVLLAPSIVLCGLAWATRPEASPFDWNPLTESWLRFWNKDAIGASILWFQSKEPLDYRTGFVVPMAFGLDGRAALLPLVPLYGALLAWWRRAERA